MYKIMPGVKKADQELLFSFSHNTTTCGHPMMLNAGRFRDGRGRGRERKYFFTQRTVKSWNSLPEDVALATNLDAFKIRLDMKHKAIGSY